MFVFLHLAHGAFRRPWESCARLVNSLREATRPSVLDLAHESPRLAACKNLFVSVPGQSESKIAGFSPQLRVLGTKTRPKQLVMLDDRGRKHLFLLKGREELRLEEHIMQIFRLTNQYLRSDASTRRLPGMQLRDFTIVSLGRQAGLVQWVEGVDHHLSSYPWNISFPPLPSSPLS